MVRVSKERRDECGHAVRQAVASGQLPKQNTQACVDCGNTAQDYDHRWGYEVGLELAVEARCRKCHIKRHRAEGTFGGYRPRPVVAIESGRIYDSIFGAAQANDVTRNHIYSALKRGRVIAGQHWMRADKKPSQSVKSAGAIAV
jgi:hypothetical protein